MTTLVSASLAAAWPCAIDQTASFLITQSASATVSVLDLKQKDARATSGHAVSSAEGLQFIQDLVMWDLFALLDLFSVFCSVLP